MKLEEFLSKTGPNAVLQFEQVEFYHPLVILYSSGTTGTPKAIVHSHGVCFKTLKFGKLIPYIKGKLMKFGIYILIYSLKIKAIHLFQILSG
jgi:acyl-coenzyme A synthetase/AMP-(fatty) acid ligase